MKLTNGDYAGLHIDECPSEYLLWLSDHGDFFSIRYSAAKEYARRTREDEHTEEVVPKIGDKYK